MRNYTLNPQGPPATQTSEWNRRYEYGLTLLWCIFMLMDLWSLT